MSGLVASLRWELLRLQRSRRIFLLVIPPIAGPIGSALAFLYFGHTSPNGAVLTHPTALVLGLIVTGGLSGMVLIDLAALSAGEELSRRANLTFFALPQERWEVLGGRLAVDFALSLGAFLLGAAATWEIAGVIVPAHPTDPYGLFDPFHLLVALVALLAFLGAIGVAASIFTRSASEAIVAAVLAGVTTAGVAAYLVFEHQVSMAFPAALALAAAVCLGWSFYQYELVDA